MKVDLYVDSPGLKADIEKNCSASHRLATELHVRTYANVVFDPRWGLFREDGVHVCPSFAYAQDGIRLNALQKERRLACPKPMRRVGKEDGPVFYLGVILPCWGHLLIDSARFLWAVTSGALPPNARFAYSLGEGLAEAGEIPKNYAELLSCAGIDLSRLVRVSEPTAFDEILFADEAFLRKNGTAAVHFFTDEAAAMYERIAQAAAPDCVRPPFRKVFLSRSRWKCNAKDFGERRIGEAFRDSGFELVSPECLSFREMVARLRETKTLAATEGSIAHNALFLQKGAEIVLLPKAGLANSYQAMVNEMRGLRQTYVEANVTRFQHVRGMGWEGPFCLVVTRQLARYLGCRPERALLTRLKFLAFVFFRRLCLTIRR